MDPIDRGTAIDALWKAMYEYEDKTEKQFQESEDLDVGDWIVYRIFVQNMNDIDRQTILNLPFAQPDLNQWCTDCKEYDKEKHHCPRFNRVIREALKDTQPEIIYCKDCVKHNIGVDDTPYKSYVCPLVKFRGKAQGHEFDYQYCAYGRRKE